MKAKAILSAITGFFFGLITYLVLRYIEEPDALILAVISGLLFYLLLFPFLIIYGKILDKRYEKFEKEITSPVFYKTNGNFYLGGSDIKNGNIYFCKDGIVCVCLEDKPHTLDEILLQNIDHVRYTSTQLSIFTNDERVFVITLSKTKEIIDLLVQKEWIAPR